MSLKTNNILKNAFLSVSTNSCFNKRTKAKAVIGTRCCLSEDHGNNLSIKKKKRISSSSSSDSFKSEIFNLHLLTTGLSLFPPLDQDAALAATASYDPSVGSEFLKNLTGVGYVSLVIWFLYRVLSRRANKFRTEKLSSTPEPTIKQEPDKKPTSAVGTGKRVTFVDSMLGAAQAGLFAFGLFVFTTKVDGIILNIDLPDQYTARNIAITVRTIIRGLAYLVTFFFGVNCFGLLGLTVKLIFDPSAGDEEIVEVMEDTGKKLPRISITSDPEEVRQAFDSIFPVTEEEKEK